VTPERWGTIQSLFLAAAPLRPADRAEFLTDACGSDASLRRDLEGLLAAEQQSRGGAFIEDIIAAAAGRLAFEGDTSRTGEHVGPYRLIREIGRGGMGTVYLAERVDEAYRASVAIKFLRGALATPEFGHRFRVERQILADLTHPNIAWLLDGGTAPDGTPYLVMEHVDGRPIDEWCDERNLGLSGRLALFQQVCAAVQHAHQALVVHRDLKPSNILVSGDGTPKLVDFGIAKLLTADQEVDATTTMPLLTPAYAAPEQARGGRITVATDVYALGGVLYRLLTGRTPLDLSDATPGEVERRIAEQVPVPPSVAALGPHAAWRRRLAGDLDTIVLKALRKEPERRYASVDQLADDLRRYVDGRPVRARRDTLAYRTARFVGRHRAGTVAMLGLVVLTVFYVVRITVESARARREAQRATQVAEFLKDLFRFSDPIQAQGRTLTARDLLDRGAERVAGELSDQPETQAELMGVIGDVYLGLGLYAEAGAQLERGLAVRRRLQAVPDARTAGMLDALGVVRRLAGDYAAAESLALEAISVRRRLGTDDDTAFANSIANLAEVRRVAGRVTSAESLYRRALEIRRRDLPPGHRDVADNLNNLALVIHGLGDYAEAERMHREALALRRPLGEGHPDVSNSLQNLALTLVARGGDARLAEAESLYTEALALRRRTLGADEPRTLNTQQSLGGLLIRLGEYRRAQILLEDAVVRATKRLGRDHLYTTAALTKLALALSALGADDSARRTGEDAVARMRRALGDDHPNTLTAMVNFGRVLAAAGDTAAGRSWLRRALDGQRRALPAGHPAIAATETTLTQLGGPPYIPRP
jgi:eukaryotic-like serine/threonine-protein kinase